MDFQLSVIQHAILNYYYKLIICHMVLFTKILWSKWTQSLYQNFILLKKKYELGPMVHPKYTLSCEDIYLVRNNFSIWSYRAHLLYFMPISHSPHKTLWSNWFFFILLLNGADNVTIVIHRCIRKSPFSKWKSQ